MKHVFICLLHFLLKKLREMKCYYPEPFGSPCNASVNKTNEKKKTYFFPDVSIQSPLGTSLISNCMDLKRRMATDACCLRRLSNLLYYHLSCVFFLKFFFQVLRIGIYINAIISKVELLKKKGVSPLRFFSGSCRRETGVKFKLLNSVFFSKVSFWGNFFLWF